MAKEVEIPELVSVPNNWITINAGKVVKMLSGFPFDSSRFSNNKSGCCYPLIRIRDIVRGYTETYTDEECPEDYIIHKGDILIGMDGDFNISKWESEDALLNQRVCLIKSNSPVLLNDFLYYYLPYPLKKVNESTPSVTVKHLSTKTISLLPLPIPPIAEQHRIVDRIERFFEKLDNVKELAQNALDAFEARKAAILHKAFTGELTAKWREENGVGMDSWEEKTLCDVCKSIFDGDHMPPPQSETGVPFLVISNVNTGYLSFENTRFVSRDYYSKLSHTRKPEIGDVLYTIVGSYGIPVLIDDDREFCFQRYMALLKPKSIDSKFLWYLLQTGDIYKKATEIATGTAQLTVPIKRLRQLRFDLPSVNEQQEIVRILDNLFEKEQKAKGICDIIDKIDLMKKAILARAFRGELGTNGPSEGSAVELLKECLK